MKGKPDKSKSPLQAKRFTHDSTIPGAMISNLPPFLGAGNKGDEIKERPKAKEGITVGRFFFWWSNFRLKSEPPTRPSMRRPEPTDYMTRHPPLERIAKRDEDVPLGPRPA